MALTLKQKYDLAHDHEFIVQVMEAAVAAGIAIQSESAETPNHANRSAYAKLVLGSPYQYSEVMAHGVASQLTSVAPTDSVVSNQVSAIWNAYAGVL